MSFITPAQILEDLDSDRMVLGRTSNVQPTPDACRLPEMPSDEMTEKDIQCINQLVNTVRNIQSQTPAVIDARVRIDQIREQAEKLK
ncbi:hypothetical protein H4R99_005234 [Coemansia sp. RSA 1722]|nr:hypothetical protein IWW45_001250 [Coemansia sp. RSA 485]KAJ2595728.1 hypothetical protein H4R99_005234 [Coemansia sp. RSA 1722]KAJ2599057.1 hypothetical protein GGF39_002390 [Coemansia sp. RSA 1721]